MSKKILVVGAGSIGERHTRCFCQLPGVTVSVCDLDAGILGEIDKKYDIEGTYNDWNKVPLDDFYAVIVCTPANVHIPMARKALEHNCHVLCEKPLAVDLEGILEFLDFADECDVTAAVAYVWRCNTAAGAMKAVVDSGVLGEINHVFGYCAQELPKYRPAYADVYYKDHKTGGGALQDAVTHMVNLLEWHLGRITEVFCLAGHQVLPKVEVEDTAALVMRFENWPAIGTFTLNQFQKPDVGTIVYSGTKTSARLNYVKWSVEVYNTETGEWEGKTYPVYDRDEIFISQAKTFIECCQTGKPVPCTLREAFDTLKTIKTCFASWESGKMLKIE